MLIRKIGLWGLFTFNLLAAYYIGFIISSINNPIGFIFGSLILSVLLMIKLLVTIFYMKKSKILLLKRIIVWLMLLTNTIFAFLIGFTIPTMQTPNRDNMGYVMVPLLIVLNYIIVERFHFYLKKKNGEKTNNFPKYNGKKKIRKPIIEYDSKKYQFSIISIIILGIGAPLLAWLIYLFFDNYTNYWLHEIVVKQTAIFLKLLFNMNVEVVYTPIGLYHWGFYFPSGGINDIHLQYSVIQFETFCTGIQAICVFAGIIIFTPHSKDLRTKKDMIWRKTKSLIVSSLLFYIVNIIRMLIQLQLYYIGYLWEDIHVSISAASSFIAAIIVLLLHKWIPEFIISIIYVGTLISEPIKAKRKERVMSEINTINKVNLNLIRKALGMKSKIFNEKFREMAKNYNFEIKEPYLIVPNEQKEDFFEAFDNKFKQDSK
ncbi:MAG: archaeosortase H [Promethearchaeota archaeon]